MFWSERTNRETSVTAVQGGRGGMQTTPGLFTEAFSPREKLAWPGLWRWKHEKWSYSSCSWKREPIGFACDLDVCGLGEVE